MSEANGAFGVGAGEVWAIAVVRVPANGIETPGTESGSKHEHLNACDGNTTSSRPNDVCGESAPWWGHLRQVLGNMLQMA